MFSSWIVGNPGAQQQDILLVCRFNMKWGNIYTILLFIHTRLENWGYTKEKIVYKEKGLDWRVPKM